MDLRDHNLQLLEVLPGVGLLHMRPEVDLGEILVVAVVENTVDPSRIAIAVGLNIQTALSANLVKPKVARLGATFYRGAQETVLWYTAALQHFARPDTCTEQGGGK